MGEFFDCKRVAEYHLNKVKDNLKKLSSVSVLILSGEKSDANEQYKYILLNKFMSLGINAKSEDTSSPEQLEKKIKSANDAKEIMGIFTLFPTHFNVPDEYFMSLINEHKDIEGVSGPNVKRLVYYEKFFDKEGEYKAVVPCTAKAVVKLLDFYKLLHIPSNDEDFGDNFVIINNSHRVGGPLHHMLQNLNQTTTICHKYSRKSQISNLARDADIIVTAVPSKLEIITPSMIESKKALIDCSYEGNYDPEKMKHKVDYLIGPKSKIGSLTTVMAMLNTTYLAGFLQNVPTKDF